MVKLTRTLAIIPTVMIFTFINLRFKRKALAVQESPPAHQPALRSMIPWFSFGFAGMAVVNSFGLIPEAASSFLKELSKFLMVTALAAIGLNTDFRAIKKSGAAPMLHGFIISLLVVLVAIGVIRAEQAWGLL